MNENYPIVRLQDPKTGNVYYCRTTNWSSVGVDGDKPETVNFTLNSAVTPGNYELTVVGTGITSDSVKIRIKKDELRMPEDGHDLRLPVTSDNRSTGPTNGKRLLPQVYRQE